MHPNPQKFIPWNNLLQWFASVFRWTRSLTSSVVHSIG